MATLSNLLQANLLLSEAEKHAFRTKDVEMLETLIGIQVQFSEALAAPLQSQRMKLVNVSLSLMKLAESGAISEKSTMYWDRILQMNGRIADAMIDISEQLKERKRLEKSKEQKELRNEYLGDLVHINLLVARQLQLKSSEWAGGKGVMKSCLKMNAILAHAMIEPSRSMMMVLAELNVSLAEAMVCCTEKIGGLVGLFSRISESMVKVVADLEEDKKPTPSTSQSGGEVPVVVQKGIGLKDHGSVLDQECPPVPPSTPSMLMEPKWITEEENKSLKSMVTNEIESSSEDSISDEEPTQYKVAIVPPSPPPISTELESILEEELIFDEESTSKENSISGEESISEEDSVSGEESTSEEDSISGEESTSEEDSSSDEEPTQNMGASAPATPSILTEPESLSEDEPKYSQNPIVNNQPLQDSIVPPSPPPTISSPRSQRIRPSNQRASSPTEFILHMPPIVQERLVEVKKEDKQTETDFDSSAFFRELLSGLAFKKVTK